MPRRPSPPTPGARARRLALIGAAGLAGACNQAFGLDPVALHGDAADDGGGTSDAGRCEAPSAAAIEGGGAVDGTFAYGVAAAPMFGDRVFLIGTRDGRGTDGATAAITFPTETASTWTTRALGGTGEDQLWTAASTGTELVAGGVTRSFLSGSLVEGLLVQIDATNTMSTWRLRAAVSIQVHAVAAAGAGAWWIAGTAGDPHGALARLPPTATSVEALRFTIDGVQPVVRRVVDMPDDPDAPCVVGQLGDTATGFVARIDTAPSGAGASWAVTVPIVVRDAAWLGTDLWVAGQAGADGALLRFDIEGMLRAAWRVPDRPLHRIDRRGATTWLGGATDAGVFVATLAGDCLSGTDLPGLAPAAPLAAPLPLEVGGAVPYVAGRVGSVARAIPLGEDGTATCGVPFAALREPVALTATPATYATTTPITLFHEPISAITAAVTASNQATSCP